MKNVLMIAYTFPPRGGSGVQRTLKFVKYLPKFNWKPVVLTVKNRPSSEIDETLLKEIPNDIKVYRTKNLISDSNTKNSNKNDNDFLKKFFNFIETYLLIPDFIIGWFPLTFLRGLRIIKENKIDIIFSTSYPHTDHLLGYFLKKFTGKPWISDYRDPWSDFYPYEHKSKLRNKIDEYLEKKFIYESDRVIVTCEELKEYWQDKYEDIDKGKIITITNGYDKKDFENIRKEKHQSNKFSIVFTGRFNNEMNSSVSFLESLSNIVNKYDRKYKDIIEFILVGRTDNNIDEILKRLKIDKNVKCVGYVSHKESISYLYAADLLLLTRNIGRGINLTLPGKLFEYIVVKKPILALVTKGATSKFIEKYNLGFVIRPDKKDKIEELLLKLIRKDKLKIKPDIDIEEFERTNLTKKLSKNLDKIVEK